MNTPTQQYRTPAVVVGMNLGGLGVVRSLSAAGIPVIAVHDDDQNPEMSTRHAMRKVVLPIRTEALVEGLLQLARELPERPVLIATLRLPLLVISEHRARLAEAYRFTLPPHQAVVDAENKEALMQLVAKTGLQLPRTLLLQDDVALDAARDLRFPVIVKPADNDIGYMQRFEKAYILDDMDALTALAHAVWPHYRNLVLQEWLPGGDEALYYCLQYRSPAGERRASFVGRKLYSWPPGKGATAACTAATEHVQAVESFADAFLGGLELTGFVSIELKRDPRDGAFYMIEPTVGRTDQQEEIATLNGVNLPAIGYCDLLGLPLPPLEPAARPQTWFNRITTGRAQKQLRARGAPLPSLRVNGGRAHDAYFRTGDPLPGILSYLGLVPRIERPLRSSVGFLRRLAMR